MTIKIYTCECGQSFEKTGHYAAHARYCRVHAELNNRNYDAERETWRLHLLNVGKQAVAQQKAAYVTRKEQQLQQWVSEKHTCEKCGKVMTEKFGSGRFCSRSCANSKPQTKEAKLKIRQSVLKTIYNNDSIHSPQLREKSKSHTFGYYKGIFCGSSYELAFLAATLLNGVNIERCPIKLYYIHPLDQKQHVYIPDFYLPETNTIVEIKSELSIYYNEEEVKAKNKAVTNSGYNLLYVPDQDIIGYFDIVKKHFEVTDITCLYDDAIIKENKKHVPRTAGRVWVYNVGTQQQTLIKLDDLDEYITKGWIKGRPAHSSFKSS